SMVSYWLTMVIAANVESDGWSRYAYVGDDGKIIWGPVWDFDNSCGGRSIEAMFTEDAQGNPVSVSRNEWYSSGWNVGVDQGYGGSAPATCFYPEWSDDPYFCLKLYEKFKSIAGYLDRLVADDGLIEEYIGYLRESGDANAETWAGKVYDTTRGFYVSKHIAFSGEFSEPEWMRTVLKSRIEWMRARMTSLADTISSLRCSSTNPYVDGSSAFEFDFGSVPGRLHSKEPTPDVVILAGDDLGFSLSLSGAAADAELVAVYANGIFAGSHPVAEGRVSLDIGALPLTNRDGNRNLVLFAAKAQDGSTLATSYALVTMAEDENEFLRYADCATVVSGDASAVALDTRAVPADGVRVPRSLDEVLPFALCGDSDWRLGGNAGFVLSAIVEHRGENVGKILKSGSGEMVYENRRFPKSVVEYRLSHGNTEEETAIFDFSAIGDCTSADFLFPGLSLTIR
ncbi:MAG: hypothetical protein ILO34_07030, partial [Kiritimatiellae bacterium]|nr:hypothetical protein [Kiritimatiellia bacterium]